MYSIIQFLGRISVWRDYFPSDFSKVPIELYQAYGSNIEVLYEFLYTHKEFSDIDSNFIILNELIAKLA